jgi:3'(2'), 5'-bisphosphate nucleotidase
MLINNGILQTARKIAYETGDIIMSYYQKDIIFQNKTDESPLTQADLAANQWIENSLRNKFPTIPILSEESTSTFTLPIVGDYYWLVDPLDGTKEFIKKNGEFTVNIALIKKDKPIIGVVYAPALKTMYYAATGAGAFKSISETDQISIKTNTTASKPIKVACSRSHADHHLDEWLQNLDDYQLIHMGSSLKICLVADGQADIYPRTGPTSLWDTAAAECVLVEAGGMIKDFKGNPLNYSPSDQWLNPWFIANSH